MNAECMGCASPEGGGGGGGGGVVEEEVMIG